MKSTFVAGLVVVAVLASAGTGWAQSVGGGFKIGANFATVSGGDSDNESTRTGLLVGGFLTVPGSGTVAFQPEVLYSQMGTKFEDDGDDFTAKVDEIQIPLLLRLGGGAATSGAYFLAGPSIGIITSAKLTGEGLGGFEEDFKDELKSTDVGFLVGGGITISRFLLEARYTFGMTNLNDDDFSDEDNKSRVFSVLVGFGF